MIPTSRREAEHLSLRSTLLHQSRPNGPSDSGRGKRDRTECSAVGVRRPVPGRAEISRRAVAINPLIGSAGIASIPIAARVSHIVANQANPHNHLIFHAMGPNLAGVFGTAISGGIMLALLGVQ